MLSLYRTAQTTSTTTPSSISPVPLPKEKTDYWALLKWINPCASRRNSPNRATTNPNPIKASPVLIQARNVRSAAR